MEMRNLADDADAPAAEAATSGDAEPAAKVAKVAKVEEKAPAPKPVATVASAKPQSLPPVDEANFSKAHASPSVRKLARELGVNLVQVSGKVRARLEVPAGISEDEAIALALGNERIVGLLDGLEPKRVIARPPKLVNIVM